MSITLWRASSEQKLTKQLRTAATTARAKNKTRNGTNLLRKNFASRKTKKSYTQELPVSIRLLHGVGVDRGHPTRQNNHILLQGSAQNGGFHFSWKPPLTFSPVAAFPYATVLR
jgi:hypothetical protein